MKIILNKLIITNFKGIKALTINFDPYNTVIFGANEAGKSTISDAWHWLLTGKNSVDQKDFNIKNTSDTSLNRGDHEVTAHITANGAEIILKKVYREKWQKKRGSENSEFTGNETVYFFNDVPVQQYEYQARINGMLDENVLKMITNPLFFNSNTTNWNWKHRREVLLKIAGEISNDEIFAAITNSGNQAEVEALAKIIGSGKTINDYKIQIGAQKKKLKEEIGFIPARIDETNRSKSAVLDWNSIECEIASKTAAVNNIDETIADQNKALKRLHEKLAAHQNKIHELSTRKNEISFRISSKISQTANNERLKRSEVANKVNELERDFITGKNKLNDLLSRKSLLENNIEDLRKKWAEVNATEIEFDKYEFSCPTCRRAFEANDIANKKSTLIDNFNADKLSKLEQINKDGAKKVQLISEIEKEIQSLEIAIQTKGTALEAAKSEFSDFDHKSSQSTPDIEQLLSADDEYIQVVADLSRLVSETPQITQPDNTAFLSEKRDLLMEIDYLKKQLNTKEQLERADHRITELKEEEQRLSQQLATLEKTEFVMEAFDRTKMDIMENRVNGKFKYVGFRLFDRQVNGGESPTCETIYKEVPFSDLNTAGRIWAGMDIINTLSEFYGVSAPIFLDNRESVSKIPDTQSQVINLVVSQYDSDLRVVMGLGELAVA